MTKGEEGKMTVKARKWRELALLKQGVSFQQIQNERRHLETRRQDRTAIRSAADAYRKGWIKMLDFERAQDMEKIKERYRSPISRLIQDGVAIDGLQAYWQDDSRRHFGKRAAMFKLSGAQELPRNLFRAGDKVTIIPSESVRSPALLRALQGESKATVSAPEDSGLAWEQLRVEAEIVEKLPTYLRLKFDEAGEKTDLVTCASWRLDHGYNDLLFDRMQAAMQAIDHDVEFIESRGGTKFQYILSGMRLNDLILGVDPPSDRTTRGAFWEDARIQSWYDRYARPDPLVMDGDPDLGLNESQTRAIATMLRQRISLVQGPPGTGKTRTIVQAIRLLKLDFQVPHPILLAAHTNVAVDNLAEGCMRAGLKVVRVGPSSRARSSIEDLTLDAYFIRHPLRPRLDDIKRRLDSLKKVRSDLEAERRKQGSAGVAQAKPAQTNHSDEEAPNWDSLLEETKNETVVRAQDLEELVKQINKLKYSYFLLRATIRGEILHSADVICGSSIAAGSPELDMIDFPVVFFDEGSMATEPVSLIPLMKGCRHLSIIGDHKQLPPVVTSAEAKEAGLSRSLFERLIENKKRPVASTMLDVQFRMHPSISDYPNVTFYDGDLANGDSTHSIQPLKSSFLPTSTGEDAIASKFLGFISHQGRESKASNSHSLLNYSESYLIFEAVVDLLDRNPDLKGSEIGIVTPYVRQQVCLENVLRNELSHLRSRATKVLGGNATRSSELADVDVHTVDGFEGREKRAILFSTVRTNEKGYVGFLADGRRLNVALTRAKSLLLVVGNIETFKQARISEGGRVDSPNVEALRGYADYVQSKGLLVDAEDRLAMLRKQRGEEEEEVVVDELQSFDGEESWEETNRAQSF